MTVYGGFAPDRGVNEFDERDWINHLTVLSGDIDNNDAVDARASTVTAMIDGANSYHMVVANGTTNTPITETTKLDGFIIAAGQAG